MTAVVTPRRFVAYSGSGSARHVRISPRYGFIDRALASASFALLLALNIALPGLRLAGAPVRGLLSVAVLAVVALFYSEEAQLALKRHALLLTLAGLLALEGIVVSLANGAQLLGVLEAVTEVHLQAAVTLMVAAILAQICGTRACVTIIVAVVAITAFVAMLQMFGFNAAWSLRSMLGRLQQEPAEALGFFDRQRPMGISYSPIQLATQLCLALGAYTALRDLERRRTHGSSGADPAVIAAVIIFVIGCFASATRAPILGGALFLAVYLTLRRGSWVPLLLFIGGGLLYLSWPLLMGVVQSDAPRVARFDDNSTAARLVFTYYGSRLFLDNPLGYGLLFDPAQMWMPYWADLYMMPAAQGAQEHDLHDYVLSMLNIYGIGIILFVPLVVKLLRAAGTSLLFFIPYAVQIMFHNAGPFYNDTIVWFVIGALSVAAAQGAGMRRGVPCGQVPFSPGRGRLAPAMRRPLTRFPPVVVTSPTELGPS